MEFENTIFGKVKSEFNKIWEKEEWFPYLCKNLESVDKRLKEIGFGRVIACDELGKAWEDWKVNDCLTLAVLPLCNTVDERGVNTKEYLKSEGVELKEKLACVDVSTEEMCYQKGIIAYFTTRNLVIVKANPFFSEKMYSVFIESFGSFQVPMCYRKEDEILILQLEEEWKVRIEARKDKLRGDILTYEKNAKTNRELYLKNVQWLRNAEEDLSQVDAIGENMQEHIHKELEIIHKMPMVKNVQMKDKIYLSFGEVYLTGGVTTQIMQEDGAKKPKREIKKVLIGNLTFVIGGGEIKVRNDKPVNEYPHPHAKQDGSMCFGEADAKAHELLVSLHLSQLVKFLYSWAFSYNDENPYQKLQMFYEARKND